MRISSLIVAAAVAAALPTAAVAQPAVQRAWVDVNFGVATSRAGENRFEFPYTVFSEAALLAADYPKPSSGASFDFGGGYMFTPVIGAGISFNGTAHEDTVGLSASIPHPFFFATAATGTGVTNDALKRSEGAMHLQVMFVPLRSAALTIRVFGGPSRFSYKADMVQDVTFVQTAVSGNRSNTIQVTGFDAVETKGSGWGAHIGADVGYFFTRTVGVGGVIRFTGGSVEFDEPMSEKVQSMSVGGLQFGGGLRLRF